jgi:hypothetical protein
MAEKQKRRLLFCSYHSYLDHSSGAATRDLLELLVRWTPFFGQKKAIP